MNQIPPHRTRRYEAKTDESYVTTTWLQSARRGIPRGERKRQGPAAALERTVRRLRDRVEILVATDRDRPALILGWIAVTRLSSTAIVHYVYVRNFHPVSAAPLRNLGLATELARAAGVDLAGPIPFTIRGPELHLLARHRPYPTDPENIP